MRCIERKMFLNLLGNSFHIMITNGGGEFEIKKKIFQEADFERVEYSILKFALKPKKSDIYLPSVFVQLFLFMYKNPWILLPQNHSVISPSMFLFLTGKIPCPCSPAALAFTLRESSIPTCPFTWTKGGMWCGFHWEILLLLPFTVFFPSA